MKRALAIVPLLGLGVALWLRPSPPAEQRREPLLPALAPVAIEASASRGQSRAEGQNVATAKAKPTRSSRPLLKKAIEPYFAVAGRLEQHEVRQAMLEKAAKAPELVLHAVDVLTARFDVGAEYGDKQAQARIFAAALLEQAAKSGDFTNLESAISGMASKSASVPGFLEEKGRIHDFEELIGGWVRAKGVESFVADPESFFQRFAVEPSLREPIVTGFFNAIGSRVDDPVVIDAVSRHFD